MINGMHYDVTSAELKTHLVKKVLHHKDRAEFYHTKAKELEAGGGSDQPGGGFSNSTSGNPVDGLKSNAKSHARKASRFGFMASHLVDGETYRLSESDLANLELVESGY